MGCLGNAVQATRDANESEQAYSVSTPLATKPGK